MTPIQTDVPGFALRPAVSRDTPLILSFIGKLAEYEHLSHEVQASEEQLRRWLFGEQPPAEVILGEFQGEPVGFALFFHTFSTFMGRPGLYLEDLFIDPDFRGRGFGKAMMAHLARLAVERGCGRFEWSVLDWNAPSIAFYRRLGAEPMDEWSVYRIAGKALEKLGRGSV